MTATLNTDSKKKKERLLELDLLKVFLIIHMVLNHTWTFFGHHGPASELSPYGMFIDFNVYAAALFMFCMGFFLSKSKSAKDLMNRGIRLLIMSLLLNLFRGVIPHYLFAAGQLNRGEGLAVIINDLEFYDEYSVASELLEADILTFAGVALLVFALFKYMKLSDLWIGIVTIVLYVAHQLCAPYFIDSISGLWSLVILFNPHMGFSLFSWLPYVICGYLIGNGLLKNCDKDRDRVYWRFFIGGCLLIAAFWGLKAITGSDYTGVNVEWYVVGLQPPIVMTLALGTMSIILSLSYFVSKLIKNEKLKSGIITISSSLTTIYICQWLILGWLINILIYCKINAQTDNDYIAAAAGVGVLTLSVISALSYKKIKSRLRHTA